MGDLAKIKEALDEGADVHFESKKGSALSVAYGAGQKKACLYLFERGLEPRGRLVEQIFLAEIEKDPQFCSELLDFGVNPNCQNKFKASALLLACLYGKTQLALKLMEKAADAELADEDGNRALMVAAAKGNETLVKTLITKNVKIDARNSKGQSALDMARERQQQNVLALLEKTP